MECRSKKFCIFCWLIIAILVACGGREPETPLAEIVAPSPTATSTATPRPVSPTPPPTLSPTAVPSATPTPEPPLLFEGIFYEAIPALSAAAVLNEIPPARNGEDGFLTGYFQLALPDYPLAGSFGGPQIEIFPLRAIAGLDPHARRVSSELVELLRRRPDLAAYGPLPRLPAAGQEERLQAQLAYVDFQNGSGLRSVTGFEGESGEGLEFFYVYQGITADGSAYLSAMLPLRPEPELLAGADPAELENRLNIALPAQFAPDLAALDRLMASFEVNYPEPAAAITADGRLPLTLFYPPEEGIGLTGYPLAIEGYVQPGERRTLLLTLAAGESVLARQTIFSELNGRYTAAIDVPRSVTGRVLLTVAAAEEEISRPLTIVRDEKEGGGSETLVTLTRPVPDEVVVAGAPLFLNGAVRAPIEGEITVGVQVGGCTTFVARQVIPLPAGAERWSGRLLPPEPVVGEGCVVVYTGTPGVEPWREERVAVRLVAADDPAAPAVVLGNLADEVYWAGESARFFGAVTGPDRRVQLQLADAAGEIIVDTLLFADGDGYWEFDVDLPAGVTGPATLILTLPGDSETPPITFLVQVADR